MGNNRVNIILHRRWNLATAATQRGNAFEALMWFPDFRMLHLYERIPEPTRLPPQYSRMSFMITPGH